MESLLDPELFSIPPASFEIDDTQALEWQLVENTQRADIHPYEEALGFQRLLDLPGYDVATIGAALVLNGSSMLVGGSRL
jgi:ParB-like chromosome segregation protein Spo0J